jgi:hypothetical protein
MTQRYRVNSPAELVTGDRIELTDRDDAGQVVVIDVLWWAAGLWFGNVARASPDAVDIDGLPIAAGETGSIGVEAYGRGEVFFRRRPPDDRRRPVGSVLDRAIRFWRHHVRVGQ